MLDYLIDTALRAQGVVSLDSIGHTRRNLKPALTKLLDARVRRKELIPVDLEGAGKAAHWAAPETLETNAPATDELVHILSPFDPLIIQRKRTESLFRL